MTQHARSARRHTRSNSATQPLNSCLTSRHQTLSLVPTSRRARPAVLPTFRWTELGRVQRLVELVPPSVVVEAPCSDAVHTQHLARRHPVPAQSLAPRMHPSVNRDFTAPLPTCGDRPNWRHEMTLMAIVSYLDSKGLCQPVMINVHSSILNDDTTTSVQSETVP